MQGGGLTVALHNREAAFDEIWLVNFHHGGFKDLPQSLGRASVLR
jgi:hypothetical protein